MDTRCSVRAEEWILTLRAGSGAAPLEMVMMLDAKLYAAMIIYSVKKYIIYHSIIRGS
jgi:hypothetical protein